MADKKEDLFAPPSQEELDMELFAPPSEEELTAGTTESTSDPVKVENVAKGVGTGAAVAATQKGASELLKRTGAGEAVSRVANELPMKLLESVGSLDRPQIDKIMSDPEAYKKARELENMLVDYEDMAKNIQKTGFESADKAKKALASSEASLPVEQLQKMLDESAGKRSLTTAAGEKKPVQAAEKFLTKQMKDIQGVSELKGSELQTMLDQLNDSASFGKVGAKTQQKMADEVAGGLRSEIGKQVPEYDMLQKQSAQTMADRKRLKELMGFGGKANDDLIAKSSMVNRVEKLVTDPKKVTELKELEKILERNKELGLLKESEMAAVKKLISETTGFRKGMLSDVVGAGILGKLTGLPLMPITFAKELGGSKAQEAIALAAKSPLAKGLGKGAKMAGKGLMRSLPLVGGLMGYQEAKAAGLPEEQALAYAAAEGISPLPVSGIEMKEFIEEEGPRRSAAATRQMEGNFPGAQERADKLQRDNIATNERISPMLESSSEELNLLADKLTTMESPAGNQYADVLRVTAEAEPQKKAALLYGLYQQPAFRKLMEKQKEKKE